MTQARKEYGAVEHTGKRGVTQAKQGLQEAPSLKHHRYSKYFKVMPTVSYFLVPRCADCSALSAVFRFSLPFNPATQTCHMNYIGT